MKKQLLYLLLFFNCIEFIQAQGEISMGTENKTGGTYTACSSISLTNGFSFSAVATGKTLILRISPSTCDPFGGQNIELSKIKDRNYIRTKTFLNDDGSRYLDQIQYLDGLGRPIQTIQRGITPTGSDLMTLQEYDPFGRESKAWLPVKKNGNNGLYIASSEISNLSKKLYDNDPRGFAEPEYEASPLNRILKQYGPGDAWRNSPITTTYLTNNTAYPCIQYIVGGTKAEPILIKRGNYTNGQLFVTQVKDEIGNTSYEFKDKLGQVVLTRQMDGTDKYDTYYVYDDFGNLTFVLPPLASTSDDLNLYGYQYKYDNWNRCIGKKLPGAEWNHYVYDKADRLIFAQDGEQYSKGEWFFSIPDALGRIVLTGICKTVNNTNITVERFDKNLIKAEFTTTGTHHGYNLKIDNTTLTLGTFTILTANYYDTYTYQTLTGIKDKGLGYTAQQGYGVQYSSSKNLLTGSMTALLDGSNKFLYTAMYYDSKGNVIQSKSTNHLDGVESEYIAYTFAGSPTQKLHVHTASGKTTQTELYTYAYDHAGRLLTTKHKLNTGSEVMLAQNTYDELGRLSTSTANSQAGLKTAYAYNIRSWTNKITNTHFVENLTYNLNGNIATQNWLQANKNRTYTFVYDNLSRLKSATYINTAFPSEKFAESLTYDKMGNIKTILREGLTATATYGTIDNLTFGYTGNQLLYITDAGPNVNLGPSADFKDYSKVTTAEYAFNKNGAMTKDLNKGISSVVYNSLNLPQTMDIKSPVAEAQNEYTYTATGAKLKVIKKWNPNYSTTPVIGTTINTSLLTLSETTDYIGNKVYENGILKRILTDNGYIEGNSYYFYIRDHLGNNRIVANAGASIIQSSQFYPFGMAFAEGTTTEQGKQPYKYNGKELDQSHGLNQYDYSARLLDNAYGRFPTVDPHSENYYSWSPYAYVMNNPMNATDPTGMDYWSTNDPEEIARFMAVAKSNSFSKGKTLSLGENFNTSSWTHIKDNDFVGGLSFNDETQTFFTSYGSKEGDDFVINGVFISATRFDGNSAYVESDLSQWYKRSSGRIDQTNTEFALLFAATSTGWKTVTSLARTIWNTMSGGYNTTNTIDAGKSGFSAGNREKMGRSRGNMTGNNQVQNQQAKSIAKELGLKTKDQERQLHDLISGQGYSYQEALREAKSFFKK